jgi:hypothetical protein
MLARRQQDVLSSAGPGVLATGREPATAKGRQTRAAIGSQWVQTPRHGNPIVRRPGRWLTGDVDQGPEHDLEVKLDRRQLGSAARHPGRMRAHDHAHIAPAATLSYYAELAASASQGVAARNTNPRTRLPLPTRRGRHAWARRQIAAALALPASSQPRWEVPPASRTCSATSFSRPVLKNVSKSQSVQNSGHDNYVTEMVLDEFAELRANGARDNSHLARCRVEPHLPRTDNGKNGAVRWVKPRARRRNRTVKPT